MKSYQTKKTTADQSRTRPHLLEQDQTDNLATTPQNGCEHPLLQLQRQIGNRPLRQLIVDASQHKQEKGVASDTVWAIQTQHCNGHANLTQLKPIQAQRQVTVQEDEKKREEDLLAWYKHYWTKYHQGKSLEKRLGYLLLYYDDWATLSHEIWVLRITKAGRAYDRRLERDEYFRDKNIHRRVNKRFLGELAGSLINELRGEIKHGPKIWLNAQVLAEEGSLQTTRRKREIDLNTRKRIELRERIESSLEEAISTPAKKALVKRGKSTKKFSEAGKTISRIYNDQVKLFRDNAQDGVERWNLPDSCDVGFTTKTTLGIAGEIAAMIGALIFGLIPIMGTLYIIGGAAAQIGERLLDIKEKEKERQRQLMGNLVKNETIKAFTRTCTKLYRYRRFLVPKLAYWAVRNDMPLHGENLTLRNLIWKNLFRGIGLEDQNDIQEKVIKKMDIEMSKKFSCD